MKIKFNRSIILVSCLAVLVAGVISGCAKKPAPDTMGGETPAVTEMSSQDVKGIQEGSMSESGIKESGSMQGMQGAEMAMQRIHFNFDQYILTPEAQETLAKNADYLRSNPGVKVQIEGHCDERGSDEYNLALGERRATTTKNYMVTIGIDASRLSTISYGEEKPLEMGNNEDAWAMNRRAEFVVSK